RTLEELRRRILVSAVPRAEQGVACNVPNFKMNGKVVVGFAAFTNYLRYLPHGGSVFPELREEPAG
ncbi:MAG: hypothetical protein M0Z34_03740, partial [Nitrospiraceae bacterium]|nr:hypothetical protein [Nitrospiraceae bacterium]